MACPGRWLPLGPGVRGIPGPAHAGLDACAGMRCMHRRVVESRRAQGERLCGTPPEPAVSSCLAAARATRLVAATRHGRVPCAPRQGAGHVCRTRLRRRAESMAPARSGRAEYTVRPVHPQINTRRVRRRPRSTPARRRLRGTWHPGRRGRRRGPQPRAGGRGRRRWRAGTSRPAAMPVQTSGSSLLLRVSTPFSGDSEREPAVCTLYSASRGQPSCAHRLLLVCVIRSGDRRCRRLCTGAERRAAAQCREPRVRRVQAELR